MSAALARAVLAAIAGALLGAGAASAAEDTVAPTAGQGLAERWCAQCHNITKAGGPSPAPQAPPFATLVATPGFTEFILRATLRSQHATMPQFIFTQTQMDDIVLYIMSLKAPPG